MSSAVGNLVWVARCLERNCLWVAESSKRYEILHLMEQHDHPHSSEVHQRRVLPSKKRNVKSI